MATQAEIRAEKERIKREMAANKRKRGQIRNRRDPGDRPAKPGAKLKSDYKAAVIKTTGKGRNRSRIKVQTKPVKRGRKISA